MPVVRRQTVPVVIPKITRQFVIGFEIECILKHEYRSEFEEFLNELYNNEAITKDDGSIVTRRQNMWTTEIVTPPLPFEEGVNKLDELFAHLSLLEKAGIFEINSTCGFHVNISEKNIFAGDRFDSAAKKRRNVFAYHFMEHFNAAKWRRRFKRHRNGYCEWNKKWLNRKFINPDDYYQGTAISNRYDVLNDDIFSDHYTAVNIEKLHMDPSYAHIEIRCAGNRNYHSDNKRMRQYMIEVYNAMDYAFTKTRRLIPAPKPVVVPKKKKATSKPVNITSVAYDSSHTTGVQTINIPVVTHTQPRSLLNR